MSFSGNFRVMDADGMTHSAIGARYFEDGRPDEVIIFNLDTVGNVKIYNSNAVVLLPDDWRKWSLTYLPPTGLLCVHTEKFGPGEADNVLAAAETLRGKVFGEMRDAANAGSEGDGSSGIDEGTPGEAPPSNNAPVVEQTFDPADKERKQAEREGA